MKILIAPNSFKDSLDAEDVASCLEQGIRKANPLLEIKKLPVSDGGDGLLKRLISATNGKLVRAIVTGPAGNKIETFYGVLGDNETALIESALVVGSKFLPSEIKDPTKTTTYGIGELIKKISKQGFNKLIIGLGGTTTNDAGAGMMQALGVSFLDKNEKEVASGGIYLSSIETINLKKFDENFKRLDITVACNPSSLLSGPEGVSLIYSPKKGATQQQAKQLNGALYHFGLKLKEYLGKDLLSVRGAGGGGGIGASLLAFLNAKLLPSIKIIKKYMPIEYEIKNSDLIITGEGKIDSRTLKGKIPGEIAKISKLYGKPVIGVCGQLECEREHYKFFDAIYCISDGPNELDLAISKTNYCLENAGYNIAKMIALKVPIRIKNA